MQNPGGKVARLDWAQRKPNAEGRLRLAPDNSDATARADARAPQRVQPPVLDKRRPPPAGHDNVSYTPLR